MLNDLDIGPDDPAELRRANTLLAAEVKSQALLIEKLQHQLAGHNRHRFGSKSESLDQLNLTFEEDERIAEAAKDQADPAPKSEEGRPAYATGPVTAPKRHKSAERSQSRTFCFN